MTALLELRDIVVHRGGRLALALERLAVERGEVVAVLGPNGAGKSTLLQVAGLLLRPDAGAVIFDGEASSRHALKLRRRMAVAMQDAMLVGGSVLDNAALPLKLRGVDKRIRETAARTWLERFGVGGLAARPASRLSGGEAQRTSLARAFATNPELLLLDEPVGGLDQPTRWALLDDLARIVRETETTTVFVTHDRDEALHLADRVAVFLDGRLRQAGPPEEVFAAPVDDDVAAFIGVENIFIGRLTGLEGGLATVDVHGHDVMGLAPKDIAGRLRVCLRPEAVTLQPSDGTPAVGGSARNAIPGVVAEVRPRGAEARVLLDCGFTLVALVTRLSVAEMGLAPGTPVVATFKATAVHLLPA